MGLSVPIYQLKRQAKQSSRKNGVPLTEALNCIAKREGFESWSHLASQQAGLSTATKVLDALIPGDLVLLGARPGHGKTLMGLELVVVSIKRDNHAAFYSLECTESKITERLAILGANTTALGDNLTLDTSDEICADYIISQLSRAPRGTVVLVDYLQLLDQKRTCPALGDQVSALSAFAKTAGVIFVLISQIDRSYGSTGKSLPDITDVRLPNALDLTMFTKAVFMNNGSAKLQTVGSSRCPKPKFEQGSL